MAIDPYGANPDNTDPSSARSYLPDPTSGRWEPAGSRWEQIGDGSIQTTPAALVRWADTYRTGRLGGSRLVEAQLSTTTTAGPGGDKYAAGILITPDGALATTATGPGSSRRSTSPPTTASRSPSPATADHPPTSRRSPKNFKPSGPRPESTESERTVATDACCVMR
jgi:hypothetical protein